VALPDNRVYIADLPGLGERERILGGLAKLLEDNEVRKVIYNPSSSDPQLNYLFCMFK